MLKKRIFPRKMFRYFFLSLVNSIVWKDRSKIDLKKSNVFCFSLCSTPTHLDILEFCPLYISYQNVNRLINTTASLPLFPILVTSYDWSLWELENEKGWCKLVTILLGFKTFKILRMHDFIFKLQVETEAYFNQESFHCKIFQVKRISQQSSCS